MGRTKTRTIEIMRLDEHKSELLALALFTHRNGAKLQHPPPPRVGSEHGTGGLLGCVDVGQQAAKAALARARARVDRRGHVDGRTGTSKRRR